eukprot:m.292047 g.292047  ORF g.292047 m.292047 type:complete len:616 (+) comp12558_c0_seq1:297-2144(+)
MDRFKQALQVLQGVLTELNNEYSEHDPLLGQEAEQPVPDELFDSRILKPPAPSTSLPHRLDWVLRVLNSLVAGDYVLSERTANVALEEVERRMHEHLAAMAHGSKKDQAFAKWIYQTYGGGANEEKSSLAQKCFRRQTFRRTKRRERSQSGPPQLVGAPQDASPSRPSYGDEELTPVTFTDFPEMMSKLCLRARIGHMEIDDAIMNALESNPGWDLDIFHLHDVTHSRPMTALAMKICRDRALFELLPVDPTTCLRFFHQIENLYGRHPDILYHNNSHAADVLNSANCLLDSERLLDCFIPQEIFAVLVGAAIHDVAHPGNTNTFLVKIQDPLATLYNDISVLENHHLATAFKVMKEEDDCDILRHFDRDDRAFIRKLLIEMVLSTDMVKHTSFMADFQKMSDSVWSSVRAGTDFKDVLATQHKDRHMVLSCIVHSADLGGTAKPWHLCEEWTNRVIEEFWREGDDERRRGLPIGLMNDRSKIVIPNSQVGFIDFITLPLWEAWNQFIQPDEVLEQVRNLRENRAIWQSKIVPTAPPTPVNTTSSHSTKTTSVAPPIVSISEESESPQSSEPHSAQSVQPAQPAQPEEAQSSSAKSKKPSPPPIRRRSTARESIV